MSSRSGEPKKEDLLTVVLMMLGCFVAVSFLVWVMGSTKIIYFWTPKLNAMSRLWKLVPGDLGTSMSDRTFEMGSHFLQRPAETSLIDWLMYINMCAWPIAIFLACLMLGWLGWVCLKTQPDVKRNFGGPKSQRTAHDLAEIISHVFTGTAPVLHLRKAIALDKEPYWRRQTFPHEVLLNERINGKPLVTDDKFVAERAAEYFRGLETMKGPDGKIVGKTIGGRMVSRMIGNQVVDLLHDRGKNIVFPDRFNSAGKVIYALLCAHAFGGPEGIKDYAKAKDQLNNSARGAAHGFANLTVAQWLFDKYRTNSTARQLFAIHHWEYTYLFELLFQAKRQGKCVDSEFLWLKPMSRILFYSMNTVGRLTPHTESAAAFAQHAYERRTARRKRLPLMRLEGGGYMHVIFIDKAVKGLSLEWDRWRDGEEDDDAWWRTEDEWHRLNGARLDPPPPPPKELAVDTPFDMQMRADEGRAVQARDGDLRTQITAEQGRLNKEFAEE